MAAAHQRLLLLSLFLASSGAATRSGCPCSRLRTVLWRQLSRKLSVRDAGGPRRGWPEGVSGLSGLDTTRGGRRLGIFQRRLPRGLEGPRCPGDHAPARREQYPDATHLRNLRYADVACRCEGRGGEAIQRNNHQHPRRWACCLSPVAVCPGARRIGPRRSRRTRHFLRRRTEATALQRLALTKRGCPELHSKPDMSIGFGGV